MRARHLAIVLILATGAVAVAACGGQSDQEKARDKVCSARADISKQVDALKGLTLATATTDGVRASLAAIQKDLKAIADAQGTLSGDHKAQVKAATDDFRAKLSEIAQSVRGGGGASLRDAGTRLTTALRALGTAYAGSLGKIDC